MMLSSVSGEQPSLMALGPGPSRGAVLSERTKPKTLGKCLRRESLAGSPNERLSRRRTVVSLLGEPCDREPRKMKATPGSHRVWTRSGRWPRSAFVFGVISLMLPLLGDGSFDGQTKSAPRIIDPPRSQTAYIGLPFEIHCTAITGPLGFVMIHRKLLEPPHHSLSYPLHPQSPNSNVIQKAVYKIDPVSVEDAGTYSCIAQNSHGDVRATSHIRVEAPKRPGVARMDNRTAQLGEAVFIFCEGSGAPAPEITWTVPSRLQEAANLSPKADGRGGLFFENVTFAHQGWYHCSAANVLGFATKKMFLTIKHEEELDPPDMPTTRCSDTISPSPDCHDLTASSATPTDSSSMISKTDFIVIVTLFSFATGFSTFAIILLLARRKYGGEDKCANTTGPATNSQATAV